MTFVDVNNRKRVYHSGENILDSRVKKADRAVLPWTGGSLFVSLGMPPRIWSSTKWSSILNRINRKLERNNKTLASDPIWQSERMFYESAHAFLAAVRVPIRN